MSDNNVLTYSIEEVGGEPNIPRCIGRAKSVYQHITERLIQAKQPKVQEEKPLSVEEITQGVKSDMNESERPIMGNVEEQNMSEVADQNYFEK